MSQTKSAMPITRSFGQFLQDKGKGRDGTSGNYRRNAERELTHFLEWTKGDRGDNWDGVNPDSHREPTFEDLDEDVFRSYSRYLAGSRGLKQNTVKTYYAYISSWCRWCVNEGYLTAHFAQRSSATAPLPEDDGRRPGDQQAWSSDQRHRIMDYVDGRAREAIEDYTTYREQAGDEFSELERQRKQYHAIKATRDRALIALFAFSAVRAGELLRTSKDSRRRGVRWEDLDLENGRLDVYRKSQSWDAVGLPEPIIPALERYQTALDPPNSRWPIFPVFDSVTLADIVTSELEDRGEKGEQIQERRDAYARDIQLCLKEDIRPPSMTTEGGRHVLRRLSDEADVEIDHPRHEYLTPHGGRRGMGEVLVRAFGFVAAARYLDNSEKMVRKRYSHIEAGELGDIATEAIEKVD